MSESSPTYGPTVSPEERVSRIRAICSRHPNASSIRPPFSDRVEVEASRPLRGHDMRKFFHAQSRARVTEIDCAAQTLLDDLREVCRFGPDVYAEGGPIERCFRAVTRIQLAAQDAERLIKSAEVLS
jgi:hypothetical protein